MRQSIFTLFKVKTKVTIPAEYVYNSTTGYDNVFNASKRMRMLEGLILLAAAFDRPQFTRDYPREKPICGYIVK